MNLIFLVGCSDKNLSQGTAATGEVVKDIGEDNDKSVATSKNITERMPEDIESKADVTSEINMPTTEIKESDKYYDLKNLEDDINQIVNITNNFTRDPSHPDYVRSSHLKYYVIHTASSKENFTDNAEEFCGRYCAANWNGWQYYINMSRYSSLFPLLKREDFSSESAYKEYQRDGTFINYTFTEKSYDVENGKVLEYQLISWRLDNFFEYFEGAYDGTFLIYKIYCSPNMTVLLTPRWEVYKMILPAMTLEDSYKTWNNYIISIRADFLNKSNELLNRCPVSREFFKDYEFPEYYRSEMASTSWKLYYSKRFKLNGSVSASAIANNQGEFVLSQVNASFKNTDEYDIWNAGIDNSVSLRIDVKPDNGPWIDYYDHLIHRMFEPGKSVSVVLDHLDRSDVKFFNNITIRAALYVEENVELPPIQKTFSKENFASK